MNATILHVTNPTVIEMVKRGEIREKKSICDYSKRRYIYSFRRSFGKKWV